MTVLNNADALYVGADPVDAVYLGETKVWSSAPPLNEFLSINDQGFESAPITWRGDVPQTTVERSTAQKRTGSYSLRMAGAAAWRGAIVGPFPCVPGDQIEARMWVFAATAITAGLGIQWENASGTPVGPNGGWTQPNANAPTTAGAWKEHVAYGPAPAGVSCVQFTVQFWPQLVAGTLECFIDDASVTGNPYLAAVLADAPFGFFSLQGTTQADSFTNANLGSGPQGGIGPNPSSGLVYNQAGLPGSYLYRSVAANADNYNIRWAPSPVHAFGLNFTYEAWFNMPGGRASDEQITYENSQPVFQGVSVRTNLALQLRVAANQAGPIPTAIIVNSDPGTVTADRWHHLVMTHSEAGTATLYLDGAAVLSTQTNPTGTATVTPGIIGIFGNPWGGVMRIPPLRAAYVAIYDTTLSAARVAAHYQTMLSALSPYVREVLADAPVGLWPVQGRNASAAMVDVANGRTATTAGTVTYDNPGIPGTDLQRSMQLNIEGSNQLRWNNGTEALFFTGDVTWEFWVSYESLPNQVISPIYPNILGNVFTGMHLNQNGALSTSVPGLSPQLSTGNNFIVPGQWYHVVLALSAESQCTLYVNGVPRASGVRSSVPAGAVPGQILLVGGGGQPAAGIAWQRAAYVAIYQSTLSQARVAAHYQAMGVPT